MKRPRSNHTCTLAVALERAGAPEGTLSSRGDDGRVVRNRLD